MKNKLLYLILLITVLSQTASIAQSFTELRLKNVNGEQSSILKEAGNSKLIVLDFWATWCKPCLKAFPHLELLADEYSKKGVSVIGINIDSPRNLAKVRPFVKSHGIKYPILLDTEQEIMVELLVNVIPTILIVNPKGKILFTHRGYSNGDENIIRAMLNKLLIE